MAAVIVAPGQALSAPAEERPDRPPAGAPLHLGEA
jgi:hypothetical protein